MRQGILWLSINLEFQLNGLVAKWPLPRPVATIGKVQWCPKER